MSEVNYLRLQITNFINKLNREYALHFFIFPVMNYAAFDVNTGSFRKFHGEKGISDLILVAKGVSYYCELKVGSDRQSKNQKIFQSKIEAAGATYVIIRDLDSFVTFIQEKICPLISLEELKNLSKINEV